MNASPCDLGNVAGGALRNDSARNEVMLDVGLEVKSHPKLDSPNLRHCMI